MKKLLITLGALCISFSLFSSKKETKITPVHQPQISLFNLSDVRLHDSEFKHIMDLNHTYLLSLEPDRLTSWFRREAGLTPKAQPYPFWESEDVFGSGPLAGHIMGFYLSSMSMMYASTGDTAIVNRLKYTLQELDECQKAQGDGYLLATINGRHVFQDVVEGNFTTTNPLINDTWEPVYIMNKIMLGLHGVYTECHLSEAKDILVKMADWFGYSVIDKLSHDDMQKLLICEHGSINESYIQVYTLTGDKKYLNWALRVNDEDMLIPMSEGKDILNGWHANTQIPKFTGFESVYDYTGEKKYTDATRFFWQTVVEKHTWVMGGNSTGEHFFPTTEFEKRVMLNGGPESCNSVNMLRLTEALYRDYAEPEKIDYYEKVLFNHILANYDSDEGMCTYYTSMRPGHYRIYGTKYHSFWCCTGTGMESPAKFGKMIYAHDDQNLYVNLLIPSEVTWKEKGVTVLQETRFPDDPSIKLTISTKKNKRFGLKIRKPYWTNAESPDIQINGETITTASPKDGYVLIERTWKNGDKIQVTFPAQITIEKLVNSDKFASVKYGPIVLAAPIDNAGLKKDDFRQARITVGNVELPLHKIPPLIGNVDKIPASITRNQGNTLSFTYVSQTGIPLELIPFSRIHFSRYSIYFPYYRNYSDYEKIQATEEDYDEEKIKIEKNTVDRVIINNPPSEEKHLMESVDSYSGGEWRDARDGGYFMYRMKVLPNEKQSLYILFISSDSGARIFDVLVDGKILETIDHTKPNENVPSGLYPHMIRIPDTLLNGKEYITVKFQAHRKNMAGGIFDLRIIKTT